MPNGKPTSRQLAFANAIIEGKNPSDAYRAAYSCEGMSPTSIAREAQRVLKNPNVSPIIATGREQAKQAALWSRKTAIERLADVNAISYKALKKDGFKTASIASTFFQSLDRLNELTEQEEEEQTHREVNLPVFIDSEEYMMEHYGTLYVEEAGSVKATEEEYRKRPYLVGPVLYFDPDEADE